MWRWVAKRVFIACFATVVLLPVVATADWPTPAAGASSSGDPELILTFDDGPHEVYTPILLDELSRRGVKAVFFWVGHRVGRESRRVEARRALVSRAIQEGHIVGNHTIDHVHLCHQTVEEIQRQIDDTARVYQLLSGLPVRLFRAPYGDYCSKLRTALSERELEHLHWDIDPREWLDHDSLRVAAYMKNKLRRLKGRAVVLMHDTHLATVKALPLILDWIEQENQRREKRGGRPIRVLSGTDVLLEQLRSPLLEWTTNTATTSLASLHSRIVRLLP